MRRSCGYAAQPARSLLRGSSSSSTLERVGVSGRHGSHGHEGGAVCRVPEQHMGSCLEASNRSRTRGGSGGSTDQWRAPSRTSHVRIPLSLVEARHLPSRSAARSWPRPRHRALCAPHSRAPRRGSQRRHVRRIGRAEARQAGTACSRDLRRTVPGPSPAGTSKRSGLTAFATSPLASSAYFVGAIGVEPTTPTVSR
jgi:hypothetical protein